VILKFFAIFPQKNPKTKIHNVHFPKIVPQFFSKEGQNLSNKKNLDQNQTNACANELGTFAWYLG
jgi:hypothetical protein